MKDIKSRSVTFVISVLLVASLVYFSNHFWFSFIFAAALAVVIGFALWEFYKIAEQKRSKPSYFIGIVGATLYVYSLLLVENFPKMASLPLWIISLCALLIFVENLFRNKEPIHSVASSILGLVYIVIPLAFIFKINYLPSTFLGISGRWLLMYLLVITKATDFGAYFSGVSFGKTPLAKQISPKKTVEGLFGGILCSVLFSFLLTYFTPGVFGQLTYPYAFSILMPVLLSLTGQFGDLTESMFKRDAKVKDSNKIKGSGGILDMVDSLIFNTPLFYVLLTQGNLL